MELDSLEPLEEELHIRQEINALLKSWKHAGWLGTRVEQGQVLVYVEGTGTPAATVIKRALEEAWPTLQTESGVGIIMTDAGVLIARRWAPRQPT